MTKSSLLTRIVLINTTFYFLFSQSDPNKTVGFWLYLLDFAEMFRMPHAIKYFPVDLFGLV